MPIMRCKIKNRLGYKFGKKGRCYPNREKALAQMRAIKWGQFKV
jgi:hypothetical protein